MQKYKDFFNTVFTSNLLTFGYEQITKNGNLISLSSLARLPELFVETNAFEQMDFLSASIQKNCGFVHQHFNAPNQQYHDFRVKMAEELDITTTFYVVEECMNYYQTFIWNFSAPRESSTEEAIQSKILMDYLNNISSIKYCLKKFKEDYHFNIKHELPALNLSQEQAEDLFLAAENTTPTNIKEIQTFSPDISDFNKVKLSAKEMWCLHFYMQGMSAKEIASQMSSSRRTIEGYIDKIRRDFNAYSRSGIFKKTEIFSLWTDII